MKIRKNPLYDTAARLLYRTQYSYLNRGEKDLVKQSVKRVTTKSGTHNPYSRMWVQNKRTGKWEQILKDDYLRSKGYI